MSCKEPYRNQGPSFGARLTAPSGRKRLREAEQGKFTCPLDHVQAVSLVASVYVSTKASSHTHTQVGMFGFRDPNGIRPLVLGKRTGFNGNEWCLASEDCAFGPVGFERVRDIAPGEAVLITEDGKLLTRQVCDPPVKVRNKNAQ